MAEPNFNDPSWDSTWVSRWFYPQSWTDSDNERKNRISTTFREARKMVGKLGPQIGEMARLLVDWKEILTGYERAIKYGEAEFVLEELEYILEEARLQVEADRLLIEAQKKPPKPVPEPESPKPTPPKATPGKASKEPDLSDDEAFASAMLGHTKATAQKPPPKVKAKPYVPPTPKEIWAQRQRQMATDCDNGIKFGTHAVGQQSVLEKLDLEEGDGAVWQYRCGPENSHLRIMKSSRSQFWTKGLSHDEQRRAGKYMVYKRDGSSNRFTHVSGQNHPDEV